MTSRTFCRVTVVLVAFLFLSSLLPLGTRTLLTVIYCGCCPWSHCLNVKPAYEALHNMGFRKLKVLYIADNLGTDWVSKGYPVEKGGPE